MFLFSLSPLTGAVVCILSLHTSSFSQNPRFSSNQNLHSVERNKRSGSGEMGCAKVLLVMFMISFEKGICVSWNPVPRKTVKYNGEYLMTKQNCKRNSQQQLRSKCAHCPVPVFLTLFLWNPSFLYSSVSFFFSLVDPSLHFPCRFEIRGVISALNSLRYHITAWFYRSSW